jgi:hypothetical protein
MSNRNPDLIWFHHSVALPSAMFDSRDDFSRNIIVSYRTIRLSNFDRWDLKMGVFLQCTGATLCGHLLEWKLTPENPPADTMFMAAMAMLLPWKIIEDIQSFEKKKNETLTFTLKICILQENEFKELILVLFESLFWGLHVLFHDIFGQTIYWSTAKPWTSPKIRSNDLERSKFRQQVQSFVCVPPWRRVTFKFWKMLKDASEVTLVPKNVSCLKIWNFVQSYMECKVPSASLTLHSTKLCTKFKIFRKNIFFVTKVTSETFVSISQIL